MKRLMLTVALAGLALPSSAVAAQQTGTVLSVDRAHHAIQLVDSAREVLAYRTHGRLPRLHPGSVVAYQRVGRTVSRLTVTSGKSRSVTFRARIVREGEHTTTLRLGDRHNLSFSTEKLGGAKALAADHLKAGAVVIVTETVAARGGVSVVIVLPSQPAGGGGTTSPAPGKKPPGGGSGSGSGSSSGSTGSSASTMLHVSGTVTEVGTAGFSLQADDGTDLAFKLDAGDLANLGLNVCDTVDVTYHQSAGSLIADDVEETGNNSTDPQCTDGIVQDADGFITAVSAGAISINTGQRIVSFAVDPTLDLADGYVVGDDVDVTYATDASGALDAFDVEYVERDEVGTVTAVNTGALTIADAATGLPELFTADPSLDLLDGVGVSDQVDVTFHLNGSSMVADSVDDPAS